MKKNENLRLIVSIIAGVLLIAITLLAAFKIMKGQKKPEAVVNQIVKTVYTDTVRNGSINLNFSASGAIEAYRKVEIFAEVQGILQDNGKAFKEGVSYGTGSTLLQIDNAEFKASLVAQRSSLYNLIMSSLPDLQLDYPDAFPKWQYYLNNFDVERSVLPLPSFDSDQEKYFINGKNIISTYYNIKNGEERLQKYTISAPFNGIVTEALVYPGTLIRAGQKLGSFIDPSKYELAISLSESYKDILLVGSKVKLHNLDGNRTYTGTVSRINKIIDPSTQSIEAFISVSSNDLNDGMYLEADLEGKEVKDVFEINRKLLLDNKDLFIVKEGRLEKIVANVIHFTQETAIVRGLPEGAIILERNIPGAYDGMLVEIAFK